MPQISIIVPVYKVEPYLRRCVDSILAQTFQDFELILVDDGSPDNCPAICDEYAQKDNRIHVIHQENGGLSAARNAGIDIAQGKYLLFCDSDDYVAPFWCESLVSSVRDKQDNYIFGRIQRVYESEECSPSSALYSDKSIEELSIGKFLELHAKSETGFAWNVLYYTDVIRELGLRFRQDVIIEDLPFCLEYLKRMKSITYCAAAEYYYMQRQVPTLSRKYYQDGFRKWREKYAAIQDFICDKISAGEQDTYRKLIAEHYLYYFLSSLENTFDQRNKWSLAQKLQYNQRVVNTEEFRHCLLYCEGGNENQRSLQMLKKGNYYAAYLYTCGAKAKAKIRKLIKTDWRK